MEGDSSDTEEDYYKPDNTNNGDKAQDHSEIPQSQDELDKESEEQLDFTEVPQTVEDVEKAISEEQLDLSEIPQTVDDLEKEIKESEEQLDLTEVPQTVDDVEKIVKENEKQFDLTEIPQTVDEVKKAIKESEGQLDLTKIPQTLDEVEKAINEEQLDFSEIPKSIDELNALEDYQNKNIVKNSIHGLMRMSPEQRERLGLSREYTNHELNIFFAQNDPPSTSDSNKAKPSEVSNPEGSKPISRNDSLDGKSEDLKKESVNKTTEEEMTSESDIKQKETSSTLNKDIEKSSGDNSKSEIANIDWKRQYLQTKKGMEEASNEKSEFAINRIGKIENTLDLKKKKKKEYEKSKKDIKKLNKENLRNKSESKIDQLKEKKKIIEVNKNFILKERDILMIHTSELFEKFLYYSHKIEFIKELINDFNYNGSWIRNLRPTDTFINFLKEKKKQLEYISKNNRSKTVKTQTEIILNYINLITKIRDKDILTKDIRNLILENKGKYNAYDIEKWLLISDTSARNQLKRMFTEDEYQEYIRTQKHVSIEAVKDIVAKKGGKCYTKDIKNAKSRLHLECAEGHQFFPTYNSLVYGGTWCPFCNTYVSETICRNFFERIFKKPFTKSYPEWLTNENGNQMEFDGYNKDLRLAFEYQGIQHRKKAFGMTDEDLQNLQIEDLQKLKKCEKNNVVLLIIPDDDIVPYDKMQEYIENEYEKKTGNILKDRPRYDYRKFVIHENLHAERFRKFVENKNGLLLTPYFSAKKEVTILCENGHQWITTPESVYHGNWCSHCFGNIKGDTKFFREIGRKFGCELINDYVNAKKSLWFKCSKGHKFKKTPYWLKKGYKKIKILCPDCKMDMYAKKFQDFINKKGGSLLTPYKGRSKHIKIECKSGHIWETTPAAVYQGSWCKFCKKKK